MLARKCACLNKYTSFTGAWHLIEAKEMAKVIKKNEGNIEKRMKEERRDEIEMDFFETGKTRVRKTWR